MKTESSRDKWRPLHPTSQAQSRLPPEPKSQRSSDGLVHSDQEENERVCDEGGVFPEGLDSFLSTVRDRAERREIAHDKPRCDRGQYTRQAEMFREEGRHICGDGGESSFDEIVFGLPSQ